MAAMLSQVTREKKLLIRKKYYFFCGEVCVVDKKHPNRSKGWHKVGVVLSFQTTILNRCYERAEICADDVLRRLSSSIDLVASDAIYHVQSYNLNLFFCKKMYIYEKGDRN